MTDKTEALKALDLLHSAAKRVDDNNFHHFDKYKQWVETIRAYIEQTQEKVTKHHFAEKCVDYGLQSKDHLASQKQPNMRDKEVCCSKDVDKLCKLVIEAAENCYGDNGKELTEAEEISVTLLAKSNNGEKR